MHEYFHTTFGIYPWDLGALIALLLMVVVLVVHVIRQKKRQHDLEDELSEKNANGPKA